MAYRGNMDPTMTILSERELDLWWIRLDRKMKDDSLLGVKIVSNTQCFTQREYSAMIKMNEKAGMTWYRSAGFIDMVVMHDPSLNIDPEKLKI